MNRTVTVKEAAELLKVTTQTIRQRIKAGKLSATGGGRGRGKGYVMLRDDVLKQLERVENGEGCTEETF